MTDMYTVEAVREGAPSVAPADLIEWVTEVANLTQPKNIEWVDGSQEEWDRLTSMMVESGMFTRLNPEKRPNSFLARSLPSDVARVESRTFICSEKEEDAGPTNHWADPKEMKETLLGGAFSVAQCVAVLCTSFHSPWAHWVARSPSSVSNLPIPHTLLLTCVS